jgi:hypothetical protein
LTEVSIAGAANFVFQMLRAALDPPTLPAGTLANPPISIDFNIDLASAANASALVERLNLRIAAGSLPGTSKEKIIEIVNLLPASGDRNLRSRIAMATYLIAIHPEAVWLQ